MRRVLRKCKLFSYAISGSRTVESTAMRMMRVTVNLKKTFILVLYLEKHPQIYMAEPKAKLISVFKILKNGRKSQKYQSVNFLSSF